ncbi:uncharacterized protein PAC_10316 [Phialocephala subalpina]|uniref:2EXR domain-containing protein n=1 Tax=Phialocephala subalpina TaxID=576137 RepID=A0A1L7X5W3_9HELO|nr:uncharacterized protein PAC_10316 [Phialocephala subalpina]
MYSPSRNANANAPDKQPLAIGDSAQLDSLVLSTELKVQVNPQTGIRISGLQSTILEPRSSPVDMVQESTNAEGTNSQQESTTLGETTFHPFLRLPTELRLKIWKLTLPISTTFSINGQVCESSEVPITALLRACFESWEVYMTEFPSAIPFRVWYCIDWYDGKDPVQEVVFGQLHFGPKDAFFIDHNDMFAMILDRSFWRVLKQQGWTKDVKTLCMEFGAYLEFEISKFIAILVHFTGLEKIVAYTSYGPTFAKITEDEDGCDRYTDSIPAFEPVERPNEDDEEDLDEEVFIDVTLPEVAVLIVVGDEVADLLVGE